MTFDHTPYTHFPLAALGLGWCRRGGCSGLESDGGATMKRLMCVVVVLAVGTVWSIGPAGAASRPTITSLSGTFDLGNLNDGPAGAVCSFPVGALVVASGSAKQITFNGQGIGYGAIQNGHNTATLTNLDTGSSITVNISGPAFLATDGSGLPVRGTGAWIVFEPIAQGGIRFFHGRLSFEPVSYGVHATLNGGIERNLCDAIAS